MYPNNNHKPDIPPHPKCFDSQRQWAEWCEMADMSFVSKTNFCLDCTPEYRRKMIRQKRCEYPKTTFKTKRGEVFGVCTPEMLRQKVIDYQNKFLRDGLPP